MRKLVFILLIIAIQLSGAALAANYYVDAVNGDNANAGTSAGAGRAWQTITYAMANTTTDDIVNVASGTYDVALGETFPITITGKSVVGVSNLTVTIEGVTNTTGQIVIGTNGTLEGCGVRGGYAVANAGLVKIVGNNTTVRNNMLQWTNGADANTTGCVLIQHDQSSYTGIVTKNQMIRGGVGVFYYTGTSGNMTIEGNTIVKYSFYGVRATATATYTIKNNIISSAGELGSPYVGNAPSYAIYKANGTITASYNNYWGTQGVYYGTVTDGGGNIRDYPKFVDPWNYDYRIFAAAAGSSSPCIGAGEAGANIGAQVGTGESGSTYQDIGYCDAVNGSDVMAEGRGCIDLPWKTVTTGNKYCVDLRVKPGTYNVALGESFPIYVYDKTISGESNMTVTIEGVTNTTGQIVIGINGTLDGCGVRGGYAVVNAGLVKIVGNNTTVRNNMLQWTNGANANTRGCALIHHDQSSYTGILTKNQMIGGGVGVFYYTGTSGNMTIEGNTIVKYSFYGVRATATATYTIKNNIVSSSPEGTAVTGSVGVYRANGTLNCSYNDVYLNATNYTAGVEMGTGAITAEALFLSVPNNDYHLTAGSPCIDAGTGEADPDGTPPEMGAFYYPQDTTPPTVEVTSPDGGETYKAGTIQTITWTATDESEITGIALYYSTNEALVTIATGEANDGSYTWFVPNINSSNVKVRVAAKDTSNNIGSDESNAVFTIIPITASIAVNSLGEANTKDNYITLREAVLISNGGTGASGVNRTLSDLEKAAIYSGTFTGSADDWTISGGVGSGIADTIAFSVAGTIDTTTVIAISDGSTTIDGGTLHDVVVNGPGTATHDAFAITSNSNTIKGLVIQDSRYGINVTAGSSNVFQNNYIGTDASATSAVANARGIYISGAAQNNIIGTDGDGVNDAGEGNIISGNSSYAVQLYSTATTNTGNIIAGNYIGVAADGSTALPNGVYGVYIQGVNGVGPTANYIGVKGSLGGAANMKNVISGNTAKNGIRIDHADANYIMGNHLGINAAGTAASANSHGIYLYGGSDNNIIGTNGDGVNDTLERNVISGNTSYAITIYGSTATYKCTGNRIAGNYIGLNAAGSAAVANARGILLYTYSDHSIVGTNSDGNNDTAEANVISGNTNQGIYITRSSDNTVAGNLVGLDPSGAFAIANAFGIYIVGDSSGAANNNIIGTNADGTNDSGERNIVSGNAYGIMITATANGNIATGNRIAGNYIGTNISGTAAVPNSTNGIRLVGGAQGNYIGTNGDGVNDAAEANIISGNATGVYFQDANTNANWVSGNIIGLRPDGSTVLANTGSGINFNGAVGAAPSGNFIGVDDSKAAPQNMRNVVSGNTLHGIVINTCDGNIIAGNFVGLDAAGTTAKGNGQNGIYLYGASNNNIVGTDGDGNSDDLERNVVSGQSDYGIGLYGSSASAYPVGNRVAGNYVGTNASGTAAIANNLAGIMVGQYAASNIIGFDGTGTAESERNIISGNTLHGLRLYAAGTNSNEVRSNWIGLASDGISDLGNGTHGIYIHNTPSYNLISLNTIAFNGDAAGEYGIYLATAGTDFNKISQNSIYSNQAGGIGIANGANEAINAPASLDTAKGSEPNTVSLSGTCDADASGTTIEVFQSVSSQGKTFIGSVPTTESVWSYLLSGSDAASGETYVATATNSRNNSSIFSSQIAIPYYSWGTSPAGSAEAWIWTNPDEGIKVMSGSAEGWSWQTWTPDSGRKVPQGSAEAWEWGNE